MELKENENSKEVKKDLIEEVINNWLGKSAVKYDNRVFVGDTIPSDSFYRYWVKTSEDKEGNTVLKYDAGRWVNATPAGFTYTGKERGKLEQIQEGATRVIVYDNLTTTPFHPMKALSANQGYVLNKKIEDLKEELTKKIEELEKTINEKIAALESSISSLESRVSALESASKE